MYIYIYIYIYVCIYMSRFCSSPATKWSDLKLHAPNPKRSILNPEL